MHDTAATLEQVKEYYGRTLKSSDDLQTSACCATDPVPAHILEALRKLEPEIITKSYGCGSPIPAELEGRTVLDLGCGTGRDVYVISQFVGPEGRAIGVDMTREQLAVARKHLDAQMRTFGYAAPNVEFHEGYIENLAAIGIEDESIDVVVSNCVINLSPDKRRVFAEILRVLKPGGELYFSDVFAGRRVPEALRTDPLLRGECLGGALYAEDFRRLLRDLGCRDVRIVSSRRLSLDNPEIDKKIGMVDFYSRTVRVFKLDTLEDVCEDYGQVAIYQGTLPESPHRFALDDHHLFHARKPMLVCGNTASILQETRFSKHFQIIGDRSTHYGLFDCSPATARPPDATGAGGVCC